MTLEKAKYSQTVDHLLIKKFFYENIPLFNKVISIDQEVRIGNRIADIYLELKNRKKMVIEIQHSKISKEELLQRTGEYNNKGIHVLWILDGKGPYEKKPINQEGVIVSRSEKELHTLYQGRVYYINAGEEGIITPVYALHFTPYVEKKVGTLGLTYYRKSLTKVCLLFSELPSLQLTFFRNKRFRLVRFGDMNVKEQCIREIVLFLTGFRNYQIAQPAKAKEKLPQGLPLGILIKKFQVKYGLHMIFEVLRYLMLFSMRDAPYMFEQSCWFQKYIF